MGIEWRDATREVAGTRLRVLEAGAGSPVVILHHDIGTPDRLPFYDAMAERHRVILPVHPGWGLGSERPQNLGESRSRTFAKVEAIDGESPGRPRHFPLGACPVGLAAAAERRTPTFLRQSALHNRHG